MLITYIKESGLLKVEASEITTYLANINDYVSVTLTGTITCSSTSFTYTYNTTQSLIYTNKFYFSEGALYVNPSFFNLVSIIDGIYKFTLTFTKPSSSSTIEACSFIDITFKCKVAAYLQDLLDEAKKNNIEKVSTTVHLLHYGLINAGSCDCRCDDMCEVFIHLKELLDNQIVEDCGCKA